MDIYNSLGPSRGLDQNSDRLGINVGPWDFVGFEAHLKGPFISAQGPNRTRRVLPLPCSCPGLQGFRLAARRSPPCRPAPSTPRAPRCFVPRARRKTRRRRRGRPHARLHLAPPPLAPERATAREASTSHPSPPPPQRSSRRSCHAAAMAASLAPSPKWPPGTGAAAAAWGGSGSPRPLWSAPGCGPRASSP